MGHYRWQDFSLLPVVKSVETSDGVDSSGGPGGELRDLRGYHRNPMRTYRILVGVVEGVCDEMVGY